MFFIAINSFIPYRIIEVLTYSQRASSMDDIRMACCVYKCRSRITCFLSVVVSRFITMSLIIFVFQHIFIDNDGNNIKLYYCVWSVQCTTNKFAISYSSETSVENTFIAKEIIIYMSMYKIIYKHYYF